MEGTVCSNGSLRMSFSIYIPYVFPNITGDRICDAFAFNGYGIVQRIDFVSKMDSMGKNYNGAFVHFSHWFETEVAARFREKIEDPEKQARIVYDDPWFWIVLPNTGKKVVPGARKECLNINSVDAGYAACLEREIYSLREENKDLRQKVDFLVEQHNRESFYAINVDDFVPNN